MDGFGAMRWQPTWVLLDAYKTAIRVMRWGQVMGRDALDCFDYLCALERELVRRGKVDDLGVGALLSQVAGNVTFCNTGNAVCQVIGNDRE
jgi:hypothetical protein